ncbi:MAG: H-NS histone family protein [Agitococcus sp.]
MSIDLSALSTEELQSVIVEAQRLIAKKKKAELKDARIKAEKLAAELGFTLEELIKGKAEDEQASVKVRKPVEIRYRNPANAAETWTGRGKQPRWLVAALATGKLLEDFSI